MTEHDALLNWLRRAALAADPPPPELEGSARAAFGLSRLDHEMAQAPARLRAGEPFTGVLRR